MNSSAPLKTKIALMPWLLMLPIIIFAGCKSKWPCDVSNPYGYSASSGAALDPYAQPFTQQFAQPNPLASGQPFAPVNGQPGIPPSPWTAPAATQPTLPPVGVSPQFAPVAQPSGDGSGTVNNPVSQSAPVNPYGSISPSGGGFNTNTTIP